MNGMDVEWSGSTTYFDRPSGDLPEKDRVKPRNNKDSQFLARNVNMQPPEYEAVVLPTWQRWSVTSTDPY
jgi:hypothetical protein